MRVKVKEEVSRWRKSRMRGKERKRTERHERKRMG